MYICPRSHDWSLEEAMACSAYLEVNVITNFGFAAK